MTKMAKVSAENKRFFDSVKRAMPAAARRARRIAKMYGTPICILENGKVVVKKP
jgi:Ni,Fe-hydrogenase III component G